MTRVLALEIAQSSAVLTAAVWLLCYPSVYQRTHILDLLLKLHFTIREALSGYDRLPHEWLKAADKCFYLDWIMFRSLLHVLSMMWNLAQALPNVEGSECIALSLISSSTVKLCQWQSCVVPKAITDNDLKIPELCFSPDGLTWSLYIASCFSIQ